MTKAVKDNPFFIEVDMWQQNCKGRPVCGDVFLSKKIKEENRLVMVLSDGLGSGIKANVLASLTASMAVNYTLLKEPIDRIAHTIMKTLPVDSERKISYATFTIVDIESDGETNVVEYDNPSFVLIRNGKVITPEKESITLEENSIRKKVMYRSHFIAQKEDRMILFSDGVTQSGMGTLQMPFGWGDEAVQKYIIKELKSKPNKSATALAKKIVQQSQKNDIYLSKDDTTCAVVYFREPRRLLICTGPPFHEQKDKHLASIVKSFPGKKIICGGTTAQILSREFGKEIEVGFDVEKSGLPPTSSMEGVDLITEGILTIGKVAQLLDEHTTGEVEGDGPAIDIVKMLLKNDIIDFVVGTKINIAHQDPNLPVELEIRRNVVKRIVRLLEEKFLKEVRLQFI